ncbi:hypothetical protein [Microbacterium tumbae]
MFVSAEIITIVLSAMGIVLTLGIGGFTGLTWVVRRIDAVEARLTVRMDKGDAELGTRIDKVDAGLGERIERTHTELSERIDKTRTELIERIDTLDARLSTRIDVLATEMTEVKIAVARLEGPPRRLYVSGT